MRTKVAVLVGATTTMTASSALALDSYMWSMPGLMEYTVGQMDPYPYADGGQFDVTAGTYHGLRVSYTVENTVPTARFFDLPVDLYVPGPPFQFASSLVGDPVSPEPVAGELGVGPQTVQLDLPIYFFRAFMMDPQAYPGGASLGLRGANRTQNSTATWSNVTIEFYEGVVSNVAGNTYSTGSWFRPVINPRLGIDLGRDAEETSFSSYRFTVDMDGIYGVHTQFTGDFPRDGITYVFDGPVPVTGDYSNYLDANSQGRWGVGHTDINSIELEAGRVYTLVQGNDNTDDAWDFEAWMVGPGSATFEPDPGTPCPGDLTGNDTVDFDDLLALFAEWGPCPAAPSSCPGDLSGDGSVVDFDDLLALFGEWGACP